MKSIRHLPIKEQLKRLYKSNNELLSKKKYFPRKAHLTRSINALKKYCIDDSIDIDLKYKSINKSILNVIKNKDKTEIELVIDILSKYNKVGCSQNNNYIKYVVSILKSHLP